jgi:hypothetical protein
VAKLDKCDLTLPRMAEIFLDVTILTVYGAA